MKFIKQLFCMHLNWVEGKPIGDYKVRSGDFLSLKPWHCVRCNKVKYWPVNDRPVQFIKK